MSSKDLCRIFKINNYAESVALLKHNRFRQIFCVITGKVFSSAEFGTKSTRYRVIRICRIFENFNCVFCIYVCSIKRYRFKHLIACAFKNIRHMYFRRIVKSYGSILYTFVVRINILIVFIAFVFVNTYVVNSNIFV